MIDAATDDACAMESFSMKVSSDIREGFLQKCFGIQVVDEIQWKKCQQLQTRAYNFVHHNKVSESPKSQFSNKKFHEFSW